MQNHLDWRPFQNQVQFQPLACAIFFTTFQKRLIISLYCFSAHQESYTIRHKKVACFIANLTPRQLGGQFDPLSPPPPLLSSKERVKPCFFVTFSIIRHIFPENFIGIPQFIRRMWRIYLSIFAIFINFPRFFGFFDISLLQRNLWHQLITDDINILSLST